MKGNTRPTKPLRAHSRATTPPQLSNSLVGGSDPKPNGPQLRAFTYEAGTYLRMKIS